jgi:type III restriction enzyme
VGPSSTRNAAIIGETADMTLEHLKDTRQSTLIMRLTQRLLETKWRDPGGDLELHLFGQLKRITRRWLDDCLKCKGQDIYPALLLYEELADMACDRITAGITRAMEGQNRIKALLDPYNPTGSTAYVRFNTSRRDRWRTDGPPPRNHVDWVILDSDWEAEFCRVAEAHPRVVRYTKNHSLGLEVPYRFGSDMRRYRPDFIVAIDDGHGPDDLLQLVVEIKGYRREDAKIKKETMETRWVPGVNNLGSYGRWDFAEFVDIHEIGLDFEEKVEALFETMIEEAAGAVALAADGAGAH